MDAAFTVGQYNLVSSALNSFGVPFDDYETAERVLGHSLGGLMAIYNVSRHRKQKMTAMDASCRKASCESTRPEHRLRGRCTTFLSVELVSLLAAFHADA